MNSLMNLSFVLGLELSSENRYRNVRRQYQVSIAVAILVV